MNDLEHINNLYRAWQDATEAAVHAQHDSVLFMQQYLHGHQDAPPLSMQTAADELWRLATVRQAELAEFLVMRLQRTDASASPDL
ncbi:MAG: hypothetical protein ACAH18_08100 [Methylophilaceae bacterium]|jgi:hypothetical protein